MAQVNNEKEFWEDSIAKLERIENDLVARTARIHTRILQAREKLTELKRQPKPINQDEENPQANQTQKGPA